MTGPRGRTGRPGINGTPGIPGINAWKVKVNGTYSDQYLIPPSIAGMIFFYKTNLSKTKDHLKRKPKRKLSVIL